MPIMHHSALPHFLPRLHSDLSDRFLDWLDRQRQRAYLARLDARLLADSA